MAKMNKKEMMENMLTMPDILKEFHSYKTGKQKAAYLREMGTLNLPHAVNWENLHSPTKVVDHGQRRKQTKKMILFSKIIWILLVKQKQKKY